MEEQFEYMIDEIREWIQSGAYMKEPPAPHKKLNVSKLKLTFLNFY